MIKKNRKMASLIEMLVPFIVIGLVFTVGALLWARYKAQVDQDMGTESLERGGEE